ncbi:MAG: hypothetical protein M3Q58_11410 [Bacteroidota bacterium]|nr:hypothetical protein [Bacteroidota bacterium]
MNRLIKAVTEIIVIEDNDWKRITIVSQEYIKTLTSSSTDEIKEMIDFVYKNYYMECPFWVKLIAFKILLLQNPNDEEVKKWAVADVQMFGNPEWTEIVEKW